MDQDKAGKGKEELNPQITLRHEHIEPAQVLITVRFMIVIEDQQQRWQRPCPRQRANFTRFLCCALRHLPPLAELRAGSLTSFGRG